MVRKDPDPKGISSLSERISVHRSGTGCGDDGRSQASAPGDREFLQQGFQQGAIFLPGNQSVLHSGYQEGGNGEPAVGIQKGAWRWAVSILCINLLHLTGIFRRTWGCTFPQGPAFQVQDRGVQIDTCYICRPCDRIAQGIEATSAETKEMAFGGKVIPGSECIMKLFEDFDCLSMAEHIPAVAVCYVPAHFSQPAVNLVEGTGELHPPDPWPGICRMGGMVSWQGCPAISKNMVSPTQGERE